MLGHSKSMNENKINVDLFHNLQHNSILTEIGVEGLNYKERISDVKFNLKSLPI